MRGGEGKGVVLCSSTEALLRIAYSPAGEKSDGEMYRQVQKNKTPLKYVELRYVCLLGL